MGEVGVDPQRVAQAAAALEALRDVLAANVPVIVNTLSDYGADVNTAVLKQAQSHSVDDAASMRARARLAALWLQQHVNITGQGTVMIPWSGQALDNADAKAEAQALAGAQASKDPVAARAAIQAIALDLQDHQGDPVFLRAFWSQPQAAAGAANLASSLHSQDGKGLALLAAGDQKTLAIFAGSLAAACNVLPPAQGKALVSQFTAAKNLWSEAMLLRAGPAGSAYGSQPGSTGANLLTGVTGQLLNARAHGGYTIPLNLRGLDGAGPASGQLDQTIAFYDPLAAMLQLDAENRTAAQQVMAGYNPQTGQIDAPAGAAWARQLMSAHSIYTGHFPRNPADPSYFTVVDSYGPPGGLDTADWNNYSLSPGTIGAFLNAATSGDRGHASPPGQLTNAGLSAYAALNIINATPAPTGDHPVNLPEPIRQALLQTYGRYLPDLASSLVNPDTSPTQYLDGGYTISVPTSSLNALLQQISVNKNDYVTMHALAGTAIGTSSAQKLRGVHPPGLSNPTAAFSQLYGHISQQAAQVGIDKAAQLDLRNQELNVMCSLAQTGFGMLPGGTAITTAQKLVSLTSPVIPAFDTSHAAAAQAAAQQQLHTEQVMAMVPFVRGLQKAGVQLPHPPPAGSFDTSGKPTMVFFNWWADTGAGEVIDGHTLGDIPGGWVPGIQQEMGFGAGS